VYRRILIPVSEPAEVEPLIRFAANLLDADGEIRTLHVIPTAALPEVARRWRSSVNLVVPAHETGAALDIRVDPEVRAAPEIATEILESAETHGVDAILMTLGGDRRSRNPFVGHTASVLLHHAHPDVIVVNRLALVGSRFGRILVPSLTSTPSPKLMRLAEELSVRFQGVPILPMLLGAGTGPSDSSGARSAAHRAPTAEEDETSPRRRGLLSGSLLGRRRRLAEVILARAARERYGLLLVGDDPAHAETPILTRRFLEELFRNAPCPVVALRG
jgi:nucleotide-binding universal stress UspA family protein